MLRCKPSFKRLFSCTTCIWNLLNDRFPKRVCNAQNAPFLLILSHPSCEAFPKILKLSGSVHGTVKERLTRLVRLWYLLVNFIFYIHTYIYNSLLQSFSLDYDLTAHTTYVVYANFIHGCRDLQFKVDFRQQILFLFHGNFISFQSFWQKSAESKPPKKYLFALRFVEDV